MQFTVTIKQRRAKAGPRKQRPGPLVQADAVALLGALDRAADAGCPMLKTGLHGVHARRAELPESLATRGKHTLQGLAEDLLIGGMVERDDKGRLFPTQGGLIALRNAGRQNLANLPRIIMKCERRRRYRPSL